jgi:hypothetical protein
LSTDYSVTSRRTGSARLTDRTAIVELIGATTTEAGPRVESALAYQKASKSAEPR